MAQFVVVVPDSAVARIRAAVGSVNGSTSPASLADVQDQCRLYLRGLCLQVETHAQTAAITPAAAVAVDFP